MLLISIHIFAMIMSLIGMSSALLLGAAGNKIAAKLASWGMIFTAIGSVVGGILLLEAPLSLRCALLTVYAAVVTSIYVFGFARGSAENARLIRRASSVQKG